MTDEERRELSEEDTDDVDYSATAFDEFCAAFNRLQPITLVLAAAGLVVAFAYRMKTGLAIFSGSIVLAGIFPLVTGVYRGPFGLLIDTKARLRGLASVAIGAVFLFGVLYFAD